MISNARCYLFFIFKEKYMCQNLLVYTHKFIIVFVFFLIYVYNLTLFFEKYIKTLSK